MLNARPDWGAYAAVPIFLFWIFIVALIWLFILGLSPIADGHYTGIEVVSTFFMAGFSAAGVINSIHLGKTLRPIGRVVAVMWVSFLSPIADR